MKWSSPSSDWMYCFTRFLIQSAQGDFIWVQDISDRDSGDIGYVRPVMFLRKRWVLQAEPAETVLALAR
jgi:hypothetical protein